MKKLQNKGFTLIELVVVIVILAILIGVSINGYSKYIGQAKINQDLSNVNIIRDVLVNVQTEPGVYEELLVRSEDEPYIITVNNEAAIIEDYTDESPFMKAVNDQLQMENGSSENFKMQALHTFYNGSEYQIIAVATGDGQVKVHIEDSGETNTD